MALFSGNAPKKLKFPLEAAKTVALVKTAETTEAGGKYWSKEEADTLTSEMATLSGENIKRADFILRRAQEAVIKMRRKTPPLPEMRHGKGGEFATSASLIVLAYLVGAFAERLLADGAEVNLLSPVILAILAWSAVFYVMVVFGALLSLIKRRHVELPLRTGLAKLYGGLLAPKHITTAFRQSFMRVWIPAVLRIVQFRISRTLHWAVLALTAGVMTSVAIRVAGEPFLIGWKIPLLNLTPENIHAMIQAVWGWLPAALTFGDLPTVETVAKMNLGTLGEIGLDEAQAVAPAAVWLPRIFVMLFITVILPRLVFIVWDTVASQFLASRVAFAYDDYFEAIVDKASDVKEKADWARIAELEREKAAAEAAEATRAAEAAAKAAVAEEEKPEKKSVEANATKEGAASAKVGKLVGALFGKAVKKAKEAVPAKEPKKEPEADPASDPVKESDTVPATEAAKEPKTDPVLTTVNTEEPVEDETPKDEAGKAEAAASPEPPKDKA